MGASRANRQTWWGRFRYSGRHRGKYDPLVGTSLSIGHLGSMHVKITPYLTNFAEGLMQELNEMVTIRGPGIPIPAQPDYWPDEYTTLPRSLPGYPWLPLEEE